MEVLSTQYKGQIKCGDDQGYSGESQADECVLVIEEA